MGGARPAKCVVKPMKHFETVSEHSRVERTPVRGGSLSTAATLFETEGLKPFSIQSPTGLVGSFEWMHSVGHGDLDTCSVHHWKLGTPNGPLTEGTCRNCGATRMFGNSDDAIDELAGRRKGFNGEPASTCLDCGVTLRAKTSKRCRPCATKKLNVYAATTRVDLTNRVYSYVACARCGREMRSNSAGRHTPEACARQFCECGARKAKCSATCMACARPKRGENPKVGPTMTAAETDIWTARMRVGA